MKKFLSSLLIVFVTIFVAPAFATTVSCDNILVEEFVEGDMLDGNPVGGTNRIREEAFTPVQPSTTYYVQTTKSWHVYFYDADKNYLNCTVISSATKSITTPANAYYLKVSSYPSYGTTYQNDLMISKYPITEYQPYNPLCATCQGIVKTYESAVGTVSQNGTPTPTNPVEPTFYQQGDMILRKVGDYADSYDATTGKITRRVGVKVLNGTENWSVATTNGLQADVLPNNIPATNCMSSHLDYTTSNTLAGMPENSFRNGSPVYTDRLYVKSSTLATDETTWKNYLASQYSAGAPVTVYYPLAEAVEETVGTTYCADTIKIATTAYNSARFSPVVTDLNSAVATIREIVTKTINQTAAIASLQADKQTRPEDACPAGKKCLLVETEENGVIVPHWFPIIEAPE